MSLRIDSAMTIAQVAETSPYQSHLAKYLIYNGEQTLPDFHEMTLKTMGAENGTGIIEALEYLEERHKRGHDRDYQVYTAQESMDDPKKTDVRLFFFGDNPGGPFVILVPGGAYMNVWNCSEGFDVARLFNRRGYNAFVLSYRVFESGLLPKPIEDIARALRYILDSDFPIDKNHYAVGGYSAGGHAVSEWGSDNHGFRTYSLPAPDCLFLIYPAMITDIFYDAIYGRETYKNNSGDISQSEIELARDYLKFIGGENFTRNSLHEYSPDYHCDNYPPAWIIHGKADTLVDYRGSVIFSKILEEKGILHELELIEGCDHGFSTGAGTGAEGWTDRAISFWESII